MSDSTKPLTPQWLGRPVLEDGHAADLETRAAINEFQHRMPRAEAEAKAHEEYVKDQRSRAAAHHLSGMKAAQATGNGDDAYKHWLLYDLHMKALGLESVGPVPPEVQKHLDGEDKKPLYRFKAHKGDLFALNDQKTEDPPAKPLDKAESEGRVCGWKLGERRCKLPGSRKVGDRWFCHHHENHWANKITKEEGNLIAGLAETLKKALPLTPPPATAKSPTAPPKPALHSTVEGFVGGLKALPKGSPERGKFITQHMNHAPFLAALKAHPQGAQLHQQLTTFLNSPQNAGFRPGAARAVVKSEKENPYSVFDYDTWAWTEAPPAVIEEIKKADRLRYGPDISPLPAANPEIRYFEHEGRRLVVLPEYSITEVSEDLRDFIRKHEPKWSK